LAITKGQLSESKRGQLEKPEKIPCRRKPKGKSTEEQLIESNLNSKGGKSPEDNL
jgi:hypothetical protein